MILSLKTILNEKDLSSLPSNIQNTLNCVLESKCKSLEFEKQKISLLEKDYNDLKIKVNYNTDLVDRYKNHIVQLEDDLHKSRRQLCYNQHEKDCLEVEKKSLKLELETKNEENVKINQILKSNNDEILKLIQKNHDLTLELEQTKKDSNSSTINANCFNSLLDDKEKIFDVERNYLKNELNKTLKNYHEQSSQINKLSSELTTLKNQNEIDINELKKENSSLKNQNTFLNNLIEKKETQVNELAMKLKESYQHQDIFKEQYSIEKKEHNNLIDCYKKTIEESKALKNDLLEKIKELHSSFTESNEQNKLLNEKLNEFAAKHSQELKFKTDEIFELNNKIEDLELQLLKSNQKEVDSVMKQFYPAANTMSKLFEKNLPLNTVYSKYEELQSKFEDLFNENNELRYKIQEMITESEKSAPLIYYKTQETKKAFAEIEEYKLQLSKVSSDLENALSEIENYNKINSYLKREIKRYEKTNIDLARQVKCLTQTIHQFKGNFVSSEFLDDDQNLDRESIFDRTISLNLVTFRNIEELHNNNIKLLSSIRELSEQFTELEKKSNEQEDNNLKKNVDDLLIQIENLKEESRHKQEILSELMAERESNYSKHDLSKKDKQNSPFFKITSRAYLEEKIAELSHKLESKIEELDQNKLKAKENEENLNNQIKKHLDQISISQNEISKLSVKLELINENNKNLDNTLARYNKEIILLKERNSKLEEQRKILKERIGTFENKKNEVINKLNQTNDELKSMKELNNLLEKEKDHLKIENEMIKNRNQEMANEISECRKDFNKIKTDSYIGTVKSEMDLQNQIQALKSKLASAQNMLNTITNEKKELNDKLIDVENKMRTNILQLKQKITHLNNENNQFKSEVESLKLVLKKTQERVQELEQPADDNANKNKLLKINLDLKNQFDEARKQLKQLNTEKSSLTEKVVLFEKKNTTVEKELGELKNKLNFLLKQLDESNLKEKILKNKLESQSKIHKQELSSLNEKLKVSKLKTDSVTEKIPISLNQPKEQNIKPGLSSNLPISSNKLVTIRSNLANRPIPTSTLAQSVKPVQNITPVTFSVPAPAEGSIPENVATSSTSVIFSLPSTSTTQTPIVQSSQDNTSFNNLNSNKRQRIFLNDENNPKKTKTSVAETLSSASPSTQIIDNSKIFKNVNESSNNSNDQLSYPSSSINDQEMLLTQDPVSISQTEALAEEENLIDSNNFFENKSNDGVNTENVISNTENIAQSLNDEKTCESEDSLMNDEEQYENEGYEEDDEEEEDGEEDINQDLENENYQSEEENYDEDEEEEIDEEVDEEDEDANNLQDNFKDNSDIIVIESEDEALNEGNSDEEQLEENLNAVQNILEPTENLEFPDTVSYNQENENSSEINKAFSDNIFKPAITEKLQFDQEQEKIFSENSQNQLQFNCEQEKKLISDQNPQVVENLQMHQKGIIESAVDSTIETKGNFPSVSSNLQSQSTNTVQNTINLRSNQSLKKARSLKRPTINTNKQGSADPSKK